MSKFAQKLIVVMALLACVALVGAQGGGGGQGRRGGMQGRRGGFGNSEMSLAMRADVQKELSVTDDQKTKLTDLQKKQREAMQAQFSNGGANGGQRPDMAEMQKRMAEMRTQEHKDLAGILNEGQMKRLGELLLQREGNSALNNEATQKALGLSSDQVGKIKDLQAKQQEANQALREKMQNQEISREEYQDAQTKNRKTLDDELAKVLTADQQAKFKEMQGKPFTFEDNNGGGF